MSTGEPREPDVVATRPILGALAVAILVGLGAVGAARSLAGPAPRAAAAPGPSVHAAPRTVGGIEQTDAYTTTTGLARRDRERAALDAWSWVDRDAGVVTLPIERAMAIVAGRGAANDGGAAPDDAGAAR